MGKLDGKTVLITGGGSGIGRATAIMFSQKGAAVAVADFNRSEGEKTADMITAQGAKSIFIQVDVRSLDQVQSMVNRVVEDFGKLDVAFNNAGISAPAWLKFMEQDEELANAIIDTNLKGVRHCMKFEIPVMMKQGGGVIINMASINGICPAPYGSNYAAAKYGIVGLTKSVAQEYAAANIRIVAVCPGYIQTPMIKNYLDDPLCNRIMLDMVIPSRRLGQPEEVAELVTWLATDSASYIVGSAIPVSGGWII